MGLELENFLRTSGPFFCVRFTERDYSLNSIWETMVAASAKIDREQIKKLTSSMDGRLMVVIEKKDGYIHH